MRKIALFIMGLPLVLGCHKKEYTLDDLVEIKGIFYCKDTNKPYTGEALNYLGKQIAAIHLYKQGEHIQATTFYPNGNKEYDIQFKDNKENGFWRYYFYNGQLNYESYRKDGLQEGKSISCYENGQLKSETSYKNDIQIGESRSYYNNGVLRAKYDSLGNGFYYYIDGKVLRKKEKNQVEIFYNKEGKEVSYKEVEQDYKAQYNQ
ncbi:MULTISPECIES: toxin-antitoxin system YwqK family antitoxin [unclassified Myroides]|uniref:toxin-antitoxin system YwqK family antitoxin n=1 Tax=unclassified Myroides TaxID=2642485 RepID=UPI003D2F7A27